ncbi:MAG: hypothetical protein ACRDJV_08210 [Actinomycetota bacterium]
MGDDRAKRTNLPQPGAEEADAGDDEDRDDPTSGPGNVSVDEPTQPALNEDEE